jgi:uncharacterized RDD family membrane protein YckC
MTDPTQNPPEGNDRPPNEPPSTPPPPPPGAQGAYGTGSAPPPPPPPGDWQQPGSQMPPPSYQGMTGGPGQPADLWPRFAARLIDYVLLTVVNVLLGGVLVAGMLMGADTSGSLGSIGVTSGTNWAVNAVTSLISAAIALGYFTLMEHNRGQTVGKMLLNLETRGPDGGRPTMEQALKRNAFTAIGVLGIIPFLGFIAGLLSLAAVIMIAVTISQNTTNRHGWHDDFAGGTTVVRLR